MDESVQHVFIIGAKGFGGYGGYETFVNKLTEYQQNNPNIKYHVACKANGRGSTDEEELPGAEKISDYEFTYHNARCFKIPVPEIGPAQAVCYDILALEYCCRYIKRKKPAHPIVYILTCRIGPAIYRYRKKIHKLGGLLYLNPDGHEWARAGWNALIRKYWKCSESMMVKNSDLVICDSRAIEDYIHESYDGKGYREKDPETVFIAYGAETGKSSLKDDDPVLESWYREKGLRAKEYYLVVGRLVPENNFEIMIREFMTSSTGKDFALITNVNDKFLNKLDRRLHFRRDRRIKFVGTVYDQDLLMKIRENACAYFHGHEVGGTNPSLLEAMSSTDLNLLLEVRFNREVAGNCALYWTKEKGSLAGLIEKAEAMDASSVIRLGMLARKRIEDLYNWKLISQKYEAVFCNEKIQDRLYTGCL